ncbi:MAG: hypothetical protein J0H00_10960 [Burkholderiales bacterium]|nr:hypothetical protein [Burkholderiales bacterium]
MRTNAKPYQAAGSTDRPQAPATAGGLPPPWRVPLLMLGFLGLIVGAGAGLARLGWSMPAVAASASALHGPLMICGFFGVVISLERAVAIGRTWAYLGPLLAGAGGAATVAGAGWLAPWLFLGGGLVLLAASLDVYRRQTALFTFTLALGAACWPVGIALWAAGAAVHEIVTWWLAFLILTIAGERLELSRFLPPSPVARGAFAAILTVIVIGLFGALRPWGGLVFAIGLLALAVWLFKQDIARRTVRGKGLTRFIAVCLLSGYAWLAVGSAIIVFEGGLAPGSPAYDAALHALTLGFVFAMVFGHAAIIFPAVLRVAVPYHPTFYVPLLLLHLSLAVRLSGDALGDFALTRVGGLLNAVALAAFILGTASAVVRGARARSGAQR